MFKMILSASALLACSTAFAQEVSTDVVPAGMEPVYAGVYHVATRTFEPASTSTKSSSLTPQGVIYRNDCNTGFFSSLLNNSTVIDDGRVPSVTSPSPNTGTFNNYQINKFNVAYCVRDLTGVVSMRVRIWDKMLGNASTCTTLAGAGVPVADLTIPGLPGAATVGTLTCYSLDIDLTGFEFCLPADADLAYNVDAFENGFGYGLSLLNQTGTTTATVGGFFIAGRTAGTGACTVGAGTYYKSPIVTTATGLDDDPPFYRDGQGGQTSGCFIFSTAVNGVGYWMRLDGDLGACAVCTGNPDTDGDGTLDCLDGCPTDPNKTTPGQCGCGVLDTDSDGDGTADCNDACPADPAKIAPGQCGCGVADTDTDGDGTADCLDLCPTDPEKTAPGVCGCNVSDLDSDFDGVEDCIDACPSDPNKWLSAGQCGCGVDDTDTDGDGTADCIDGCPNDPSKIDPGVCGCGTPDIDTDGDGTLDCLDGCPNDPNKVAAGQCGCGNPDTDTDGDGIADCNDNCDTVANPGQEDCNGNGIGDACDIASGFSLDTNANSVPDECEVGVGTPFCFGDGTQTACPCGNTGGAGSGCANSTGNGALLYNLGGSSVGAGNAALYTVRMPTNKFGMIYMGTSQMNLGGTGVVFGDGLRCVKGFTKRYATMSSGATGSFVLANPSAFHPTLVIPGTTWFFQTWYRDPAGPCGTAQNLSNALQVNFVP